jgi:hypothetical protein|tara:strand:- start:1154 stop:1747 length:594 start_codon:yes stop_codon:yes gene_type:complete
MSGQINRGSELGEIIYDYAKIKKYKSFLEIGTWNGEGSTRCFIDGLLTRNDEYSFISLETSKDFFDAATVFNKKILNPKINIVYGRIIENEDLITDSPIDRHKQFLKEDRFDYSICPNVWKNIQRQFDVVLLDGGEFSTFAEYKKLEPFTKIFLLDDSKMLKNNLVVKSLNENNNWKQIKNSNSRNGFAIYEKLSTD